MSDLFIPGEFSEHSLRRFVQQANGLDGSWKDNTTIIDNLYNKYISCNNRQTSVLLYYMISLHILYEFYKLGEMRSTYHATIKTHFQHITEIEEKNDNPFCGLFKGLMKIESLDILDGLNEICGSIDKIKKSCIFEKNMNIFFTNDPLFGVQLITKKLSFDFFLDYKIKNLVVVQDENIKVIFHTVTGTEKCFINFTSDIHYFLTFSERVTDILLCDNDLKNFGIFFHVILSSVQKDDKSLMQKYIDKMSCICSKIKTVTSVIFTEQVFDKAISDRALYTTYRFVNMRKFLEIVNKPIIQSDIDLSQMTRSLTELYESFEKHDIVLFRVKGTPWRKICATLSYFGKNSFSEIFSDIYKMILDYYYDESKSTNWFIDQFCLYIAYFYMSQNSNVECSIGSMWKIIQNQQTWFDGNCKWQLQEKYKLESSLSENRKEYIKKIFIYWNKGIENAPGVVKKCVNSWISKNPNYQVILIDDKVLEDDENGIVSLKKLNEFIPSLSTKSMCIQSFSDILRLYLLKTHGGFWIDSTVFCNIPLDFWIEEYITGDFWAFTYPGGTRVIDTWFLYSSQNSVILDSWIDRVKPFWGSREKTDDYFWIHNLFTDLISSDEHASKLFFNCKLMRCEQPSYLDHVHHQHKHILDFLNDDVKFHIDNLRAPVYKLTWKFDHLKKTCEYKDSLLHYLFKRNYYTEEENCDI